MNQRIHKQPHEGVQGIDRSDSYLISLDQDAVAHRDAIISMTRHLRTACLVGDPAPIVGRMYQRITDPQPGDLVVEDTAMMRIRDVDNRIKGLGYLIVKRIEWYECDEEWAQLKIEDDSLTDEDRPTDLAWYIQYGPQPSDVCRWVNCNFTVVPIDRDSFTQPIGMPDGNGVLITRDASCQGLPILGSSSTCLIKISHAPSMTCRTRSRPGQAACAL